MECVGEGVVGVCVIDEDIKIVRIGRNGVKAPGNRRAVFDGGNERWDIVTKRVDGGDGGGHVGGVVTTGDRHVGGDSTPGALELALGVPSGGLEDACVDVRSGCVGRVVQREAEGGCACVADHARRGGVERVDDGGCGGRKVGEEDGFCVGVLGHGFVVVEVVACEIGEDGNVELFGLNAVLVEGVGGGFEDAGLAIVLDHACEDGGKLQGAWGG